MTTIAFDGKSMAADLRATTGSRITRLKTKLRRLPNGAIAGACGSIYGMAALLNWLADETDDLEHLTNEDEAVEAIVAFPDGRIFLYDSRGEPAELGECKYAIGSGGDIALAWMEAGNDARSAIEYARSRDSATGNGVEVLCFQKPRRRRRA